MNGEDGDLGVVMIELVSPKGGRGKSTTGLSLLGVIHEADPEARVLVRDMDPQNTVATILETRSEMGNDGSWFDVYAIDPKEPSHQSDLSEICEIFRDNPDYVIRFSFKLRVIDPSAGTDRSDRSTHRG